MITLPTFQKYLSSTKRLRPIATRFMSDHERALHSLLATLSAQTQEQQSKKLEQLLIELRESNIEDQQRLTLTASVVKAAEQLIVTLRQSYVYEIGTLSESQRQHVEQIKALYYLMIMIYDGVIYRETTRLAHRQKAPPSSRWQRYFNTEKPSVLTLTTAIYQALFLYQKLLAEETICYEKTDAYVWCRVNQLYYLAHQNGITEIELSAHTQTHHAETIHQLYGQICLHSLLNLRAMRRPDVLLIQRLLPDWAEHIVATIEPHTETRLFVDLHSDHPPRYLTASSPINPYADGHDCLFIELTPMIEYLTACRQALIDEGSEGTQCIIINKIVMMLSYRYLQLPLTLPNKYSVKHEALLVTGFNDIHYRISHSCCFTSLIAIKDLPAKRYPLYDTHGQTQETNTSVMVEVFSNDTPSRFCTLRLAPKTDDGMAIDTADDVDSTDDRNGIDGTGTTATPLALQVMRLFLLCRSENPASPDWSMGVVRWVHVDHKNPIIEWQVLGHRLVACGLCLESQEARDQNFVPAIIVGGDEQLQIHSSVIVPSAHFQVGDRVIMRINNKQTPLRLVRRVLMTDEFGQYEVVQL